MALNRWGFEDVAWQTAKEEGKRLLASYARRRRTIPYSEFVKKIGAIHLEPNDPRLHHFLDEISTEEHSEERGLLSALVVHKLGDAQPGPGFFELARQLGYQFENIEQFWIQEVKHVFEVWSASTR